MSPYLHDLVRIAAQSPSSSGGNASTLGGVLVVVGIVLAVALVVGLAAWLLASRGGRAERHIFRRRPYRRGRIGRIR
jgi:hypothetical protein